MKLEKNKNDSLTVSFSSSELSEIYSVINAAREDRDFAEHHLYTTSIVTSKKQLDQLCEKVGTILDQIS